MTLQDLGSIGDLIAAVATVATLAYLALQIRQNTLAIQGSALRESQALLSEAHFPMLNNPELGAIFEKGLADPDSLSDAEADAFDLALYVVNCDVPGALFPTAAVAPAFWNLRPANQSADRVFPPAWWREMVASHGSPVLSAVPSLHRDADRFGARGPSGLARKGADTPAWERRQPGCFDPNRESGLVDHARGRHRGHADRGSGSIQMKMLDRYFDALRAQDWRELAGCLAEDVERTGPYLDIIRGRRAYVEFLSAIIPTLRNYDLKVQRIRRLEGDSALVELSETLDVDGVRAEFPEAILFEFGPGGLILRVDVYIKQLPTSSIPRARTPVTGDTRSDDS